MIRSFFEVGRYGSNLMTYGTEREFLIARGVIVPIEARREEERPMCLMMLPGERDRNEKRYAA